MTAGTTTDLLDSASAAARPLKALPVLAWHEGRRMALHPLLLASFALLLLQWALADGGAPREAFELATMAPTWFCGVAAYFAAHLVATRDRRAHSGEWLASLPTTAQRRVAALCLGALVPTAVVATAVAGVHLLFLADDRYWAAPTLWHLASGPLTVLGGALLGVMVARATSLPGTALLVMVAMVMVNVWLNNRPDTVQLLGTFTTWTVWPPGNAPAASWAGLIPGSAAWHAAYLLALCGMAAAGAFLRGVGTTRPALLAGGACTAAAVVSGLLQLP